MMISMCKHHPKTDTPSLFGETLSALINWYVLTHVVSWNFTWITPSYTQWLPIALTVLGIDYACDLAQILFHKKPIRHLFKIIANVANFVSVVMLLRIFPLQFPESFSYVAFFFKLALIISLVVMLIESTIRLFQLVSQIMTQWCAVDAPQANKKKK